MTCNCNQIILIDKPAGLSSFGVVSRVRRKLTEQAGHKVKVGHCGTLDPFATGLLILVTGQLTKQAGQFSGQDKTYQATVRLGETSTTGDPEGDITAVPITPRPTRQVIQKTLAEFIGPIRQTPPLYSAIKINGQRAYKLARAGVRVEVPPRQVIIHSIKLLNYNYPLLEIETRVSSGTYIRSLASDIGQALGGGAYLTSLRRLSIGEHSVVEAEPLDNYLDSVSSSVS